MHFFVEEGNINNEPGKTFCLLIVYPRVAGILLALFSALLLIVSFPPFDHEYFAWIALVPLLVSIDRRDLKSAFFLSFLTGIVFFMGVFYWINVIDGFSPLDFLLLGIYLGSFLGVFGGLLNLLRSRTRFPGMFIAPVLWVPLEYLRGNAGFLSLPWAFLAHSQYLNLPVIQISSVTGAYGVSFLVVAVNAALGEVLNGLMGAGKTYRTTERQSILKPVLFAFLLLGASLGYGFLVLKEPSGRETVSLSVIQGNIPQNIKWSPTYRDWALGKHVRLTEDAARGGRTSLIVWPETAVPGLLTNDIDLMKAISDLAKRVNVFLLIGGAQRPKFGISDLHNPHRFNSAFLVSPLGRIRARYNKIRLLPFGEYLPLRDRFPWPPRIAAAAGYFLSGGERTVFDMGGSKCSVLICWESIFPDHFRRFIAAGARFAVNITNEAWFGETAASYQFVAMNVFRAVENRVAVVRSANTGISCFIGPRGEIMGKVSKDGKDLFVEGYLTKEIPLRSEKSFYTINGDMFALLCTVLAGILFVAAVYRSMNSFRRADPPSP